MKNCGCPHYYLLMSANKRGDQPIGAGRTPSEARADAAERHGGGEGVVVSTDESTFNRAKAHLALWDARCRWAAMVGDDLASMPPGYSNV